MQPEPRVSVIITSYNHESFVAQAIDSVLAQTYPAWEIVVRDDGSTDRTPAIVASYTDPRVRFLGTGANLGASLSANECLKEARGEYIAILNSDDVFEPQKLAVQVAYLDANPGVAAVFSQARLVKEDGMDLQGDHAYSGIFHKPNRSRHEWLRYFFDCGNCLCDPSVLVRRSVYEELGMYDARLAAYPDFDLWIRVCLQHEIHILPDKLVRFRIRSMEANESGMRPANMVRLQAELPCCLSRYRSLSMEDYRKVFPEDENAVAGDVEYALAKWCLSQTDPVKRQFGRQLLYEIAASPERMAAISSATGYDYVALHRDMARCDLWGVAGPAYLASSFLSPVSHGDDRKVCATMELGAHQTFQVRFTLDSRLSVEQKLLWIPLMGHATSVRVGKATSNLGEVHVEPLNAAAVENGFQHFMELEPRFCISRGRACEPACGNAGGEDASGGALEWIVIEGNIHIFQPVELLQRIHRFTHDMRAAKSAADAALAAAKEMKSLEKAHRRDLRELNQRLAHFSSSPLRSLSLWWNGRKRLSKIGAQGGKTKQACS